jgi:hypothetical protein
MKGQSAPLALFGSVPTRSAVAPVTVVANPLRVAAVIDREGLFIGGLGLWAQGLLCILWGEETVSLFDDDMRCKEAVYRRT